MYQKLKLERNTTKILDHGKTQTCRYPEQYNKCYEKKIHVSLG